MNENVDLYKVSNVQWIVGRSDLKEGYSCSSVEDACNLLEEIGILGDEVDAAIISMVANAHSRANFNLTTKKFVFSDDAKPNSLSGMA